MSVYFSILFMYLEINKFFSEVFSLNKATFGSLALFHKTCATKVFWSSSDVFTGYGNQRFWGSRMLSLHKRLDRAHVPQLEPDVIQFFVP